MKLKQISLIQISKIYLCIKNKNKSFFFGSHLGCHIVSRLSYKLFTNNKVTFEPFYAWNNLNLMQ